MSEFVTDDSQINPKYFICPSEGNLMQAGLKTYKYKITNNPITQFKTTKCVHNTVYYCKSVVQSANSQAYRWMLGGRGAFKHQRWQ